MALAPGTRLGPYEVLAALGAGGMGEVYRARDTKLNREVAIKVLPDLFAQDDDRLARFTREAQVLASLNHPNIAAIYGIEESGHTRALVMELVEGADLSEQIARGPIPIAEALPIARQIADALAAAHEQGIIHRDLKPANIKVRADGTVKVLDFGLAKALGMEAAEGSGGHGVANSPTLTARATQMGMIIGTAAYMAPEQARGKAVDRRADVWAFGVVFYEMLAGRRAFEGGEISDVLAAVLRQEIDWTRLPSDLPLNIRMLLERCLIKDRAERLADMSVARFLMSDPAKTLSSVVPATTHAPARTPRRIAPILMLTSIVAIGATYALTRWWQSPPAASTGGGLAHVSITLPDEDEVAETFVRPIAVSDDGAHVAYVGLRGGKSQIYIRALNDPVATVLEGTDGAQSPFFSPDGRWIAFFSAGKLRKIAVGGAALQPLADAPTPRGGVWAGDGYLYFAPTNAASIWRVPEGGGIATEVTHKDASIGEISHRWPQVIPGTNTLIFGMWTGPGDDEQNVAVQTIGETGHRVLIKGANAPAYAATPGMLIYSHIGALFAVPWRPPQTDLGGAVPIALPERTTDGGGNEGAGNYVVSRDGTLVYLTGGRARNSTRLVWVDRAGRVEAAPIPERTFENAVIAPDGSRAVVQIREGVTGLWMYDFARHTLTPLGTSAGSSQAPLWSADGTRVIYRGTRKGLRNLFSRAADGSGDEERLTTKPDVVQTPTSVSSDGRWLVFNEGGAQEVEGTGTWVMSLTGDGAPRRVFQTPTGESDGQLSPDGRWIAYQAPVSSRPEIFVSPFPGPGPKRQISTEGGTEPLWSRDGRELFFQSGTRLMGVPMAPGAALSAGAPRVVHDGRFLKTINGNTETSITRDGTRFLRIQQVEPERATTRIDLVLRWFDELQRK